jgi:aspartate kinase
VPDARKINEISYDEMLEMASSGSKVMQSRSVEFAKKFGVKFEVKSSLNENPGTIVTEEHPKMESVVVRGVSIEREQAKVTIENVSDEPGVAAKIFHAISDSGVVIDMIVQNVSKTNHTDISFTLHRSDLKKAKQTIEPILKDLGNESSIETTDGIGKLSVVGIGMRSHSGVAAQMFAALAKNGINIQMISTSEIKTAVIIKEEDLEQSANIVHTAFNL